LPNSTPMPKKTDAPAAPVNFEAAMTELDALVEKMEAGQLPLEDSLAAYQRGTELLRHCEKVLADAEQRIKVLAPDGTLSDFDAQ
jgi:exodeoxyribonuclease VII small subunit